MNKNDKIYLNENGVEFFPVHRLNDLMTEYRNKETGEFERVELRIDIDTTNDDLMDYLLDFGCAGKLEKRIKDMLEERTRGYRKFRKEVAGGSYSKECDNF